MRGEGRGGCETPSSFSSFFFSRAVTKAFGREPNVDAGDVYVYIARVVLLRTTNRFPRFI